MSEKGQEWMHVDANVNVDANVGVTTNVDVMVVVVCGDFTVPDVPHIILLGIDQRDQTLHHLMFDLPQVKNEHTHLKDHKRDHL